MRFERLDVALPRLPPELDGLRIAHLADLHLGFPSPGRRAAERAVEWVATRRPDLVLLSGDLVARPRGLAKLRALVARLPNAYAVLGNHDFADSRDPFSKPVGDFELGSGRLLSDEAVELELRGRRVQLVGVDPRTYERLAARARTGGVPGQAEDARPEHGAASGGPWELADGAADLRILLCHFPRIVDFLPAGVFDLVLSGHMHDGQICLPYGRGKLRLAHPRAPYNRGLYRRPAATLHVSSGLGTTFVPLRFFARPEATELVLRRTVR